MLFIHLCKKKKKHYIQFKSVNISHTKEVGQELRYITV